MRKGKLAVVYVVILVIGLALGLAGFAMGGNSSVYINRQEGLVVAPTEHKILEVDEPLEFDNLVVDVSTADVTIKGGDAFSLKAYYEDGNEAVYSLKDGTLTLSEKNDMEDTLYIGLTILRGNRIEIVLPKDAAYELISVRNRTGNTRLHSLLTDEIKIDGSTGDTYFEDIETKSLSAEASTGRMQLTNVKANACAVKTRVGDIQLKGFTSDTLSAETNTGSIYADGARAKTAGLTGHVGDITLVNWTSEGLTAVNRTGSVTARGTLTGVNQLETNVGDIFIETSLYKPQYVVELRTNVGDISERGDDQTAPAGVTGQDESTLTATSRTGSVTVEYGKIK